MSTAWPRLVSTLKRFTQDRSFFSYSSLYVGTSMNAHSGTTSLGLTSHMRGVSVAFQAWRSICYRYARKAFSHGREHVILVRQLTDQPNAVPPVPFSDAGIESALEIYTAAVDDLLYGGP